MTADTINALFGLPRTQKRILQVAADAVLLAVSFALAMALRTGRLDFVTDGRVWAALVAALPVTLILFVKLGFYRAVVRYLGLRAVTTILNGVVASALAISAMIVVLGLPIPDTVPVIYAVLAFCTVGGVRFALREIYLRTHSRHKVRVVIYGAGQSGRQTAQSLAEGIEYLPVAFVDDNRELWGSQIAGLPVFAPTRLQGVVRDYGAKVLLLALPSVSRGRRAEILRGLQKLPVRVQTIPGMAELVGGKLRFNEITEVTVDDLLGRDPVPPVPALLAANIRGKSVMITGAGGSIGSELCRQILRERPRRLLLVEHSEFALFEIGQELMRLRREPALAGIEIVQVLASVRDGARMAAVMRAQGVQTIYHTAAYKHVPLVEDNPLEGLANNVFGTRACADAAVAAGVESFILVSTDKAVRPTNVMGASKRLAELVCQAAAQHPGGTRFSMVRFGNVLGSSGSVIPVFRRQIAAGEAVTVTHPEITRYFMTIAEAAQLVIQAGALARGGDVFLLDMGEPVRILELAERMIRLSGFTPLIEEEGVSRRPHAQDVIPIRFTRPRRGEKLFEEMFIGTVSEPTVHPRILTATETALDRKRLDPILAELQAACDAGDEAALRAVLLAAPIGYAPRRAAQPPVQGLRTLPAPAGTAALLDAQPAAESG